MSFRKKARPVIAVSAVARARASKNNAGDKSQNEEENAGTRIKEETNVIPVPCVRPEVEDAKVGEKSDLEAVSVQGSNISVETVSEIAQTNVNKPNAMSKRFKRVKPIPILSRKRPSPKIELDDNAKHSRDDSELVESSQPDLISEKTSEKDSVEILNVDVGKELRKPLTAAELHEINREGKPVPDCDTSQGNYHKHADLETEKGQISQAEKFEGGPTDLSNDIYTREDISTGFVVTESKITDDDLKLPYCSLTKPNDSEKNVLDTKESSSKSKDILLRTNGSAKPEMDRIPEQVKDISKSPSVSSRFKKRKPVPILTKSRTKTEEVSRALKKDSSALTESEDRINHCDNDICKKDTAQEGNHCIGIDKFDSNTNNDSAIKSSFNCKSDQDHKSSNRDGLSTENNHSKPKKTDGSPPKQGRFLSRKARPNLGAGRNTSSKVSKEESESNLIEKSLEENIDREQNYDTEKTSGKHVRFEEDIMHVTDIGKETSAGGDETISRTPQNQSKVSGNIKYEDGKKPVYLGTQSGSHSDADDGSQSEGEGIHHHGKRKFAPFLGPRVRQRRRLSSVNLSEDESQKMERNAQHHLKIPEKSAILKERASSLEANNEKPDSESGEKKKKRRRYILKEPKEKMTMFDYIYYNPKCSEEEQAKKDAENEGKKRQQEEATASRQSEIVLGSIGGEPSNTNDKDDGNVVNEDDDDTIIAPQIKIGEDGQIIIDEKSLLLKTTRSKESLESSEIVTTDNFNPYHRRQGPITKKKWSVEETLKFYRILSRIGTDFSFMMQFFPECTRRNLKKKFKTEEKYNGDLIDRALKNMLPMDQALLDELNQKDIDEEPSNKKFPTVTERRRDLRIADKKRKQEKEKSKTEAKNPLAREEQIVQEEIMMLEVAENVTV